MDNFLAILNDVIGELKSILFDVKTASKPTVTEAPQPVQPVEKDLKPFFDVVRKEIFKRGLKQSQVDGIKAKLAVFEREGFPLSWQAYALATSYHETAGRMQPVREGLSASDTWRKKNLRYYPYYGRGDVQLTWKENYQKAAKELSIPELATDLDLALDPTISAEIMARGMKEGWFSRGHSLPNHLPNKEGTREEFRQSRRIINLMDKADLIADYALVFQEALRKVL